MASAAPTTTSKSRLVNAFKFPFALFAGLGDIELSDHENRILNKELLDFVWQSGFSQSILAWRRRLLYCAAVLLAASAILQIIQVQTHGIYTQNDETIYTSLGLAVVVIDKIFPFIYFVVTFVAAWFWTDYKRSRGVLVTGWMLGLFLVLWPNLIPLKYMLIGETDYVVIAIMGAMSAVALLPVYLALISGITLGTKRVYFFAPSPLTGAMVVLSAAFAIIIPFAALTLFVQLFGDVTLLIGSYLLVIGPTVIVMNAKRFTSDNAFSSPESILLSQRIHLCSGLIRGAGLIIIAIWAILKLEEVIRVALDVIQDEDVKEVIKNNIDQFVSPSSIIGGIVEFLGSMMFQAVLWTDMMIYVARNDDVKMKKLTSDLL